jgi:hypothetical protein
MHDPENSAVPAPTWLARACYTPLGDALRGRWSGRLDPRSEIAAAGLPAPLASLVHEVVRRTRLWRREKADVARELVAHFADGLATGRSADELARDFGLPKQAARLIRQAKLRNRPLVWQAWHWSLRATLVALAALVAGYIVLSARFYFGRPVLAHNYWHEINDARRVPEADRAWPLYREALYKFGKEDANWLDSHELAEGPSSEDWNTAAAIIARHRDAMDLIREGAKKRDFGYYLGDKADREFAQRTDVQWVMNKNMRLADENEDLISALVEGAQGSRGVARKLAIDARIAAAENDSPRVLTDLVAMFSLAEQQFAPDATLVEQLIGIAIFSVAADSSSRALADTLAVLTDDQLIALAHRVAAFRNGQPMIDFSCERLLFDDVLQRVYTDDGHGGGRITPEGLAKFKAYANEGWHFMTALDPRRPDDLSTKISARLIGPGVALLIGTREENHQLYNSLMDEMIVAHKGPPWQWNRKDIEANEDRLKDAMAGIRNRGRYLFVGLLLPALSVAFDAGERTVQQREAIEAVIALELWRRRHGAWPASLDELVPAYLPALPADRVDGQPLRYVVRDGQPVLYSIGRNRRDDGGQPSSNANDAQPIRFGPPAPRWDASSEPDGDWILWPVPNDAAD